MGVIWENYSLIRAAKLNMRYQLCSQKKGWKDLAVNVVSLAEGRLQKLPPVIRRPGQKTSKQLLGENIFFLHVMHTEAEISRFAKPFHTPFPRLLPPLFFWRHLFQTQRLGQPGVSWLHKHAPGSLIQPIKGPASQHYHFNATYWVAQFAACEE